MLLHSADWNGLRPLIAHIPIILLLAAPFLVVVSIGLPAERRRPFISSALTLMVLGTIMIFVAIPTAGTSLEVGNFTPAVKAALEEHRSLTETTRELFLMLTVGFAALLFAPRLLGRELESRLNMALLAIYLVFYATGALFLARTAL
jgi:hypothetical protein